MKKNWKDIWFDYTITITLPDGKEIELRVWKNKLDGREVIAGPDVYKCLGMRESTFNNSFPYPKVDDKSLVLIGYNEHRSGNTAFYRKEDVIKFAEDRCSYLNWELTYQELPYLGTVQVWKNKIDGQEVVAGSVVRKGLGMNVSNFYHFFPYSKVEDKSLVLLGMNERRSTATAFYRKEDVIKFAEDRCSYLNWELTYQELPYLGTVRVWKNKIDGRELIAGPDVYKGLGMSMAAFNHSFPYSKVDDRSLVLLGMKEYRANGTAFYLKKDVIKYIEDRCSYLNWELTYQELPYLGIVPVWKNKIDGQEVIASPVVRKSLGMNAKTFSHSFPYSKVEDKSLVLIGMNEHRSGSTAFYLKEDVIKFAENNNKNFLYFFIIQRPCKEYCKYRLIKIGKTTQSKHRFDTHNKVFDIEEFYMFRVESCDDAEKELKILLKSYSASKKHPEDKVLLGGSEMYTIEALSTVEDFMSHYTQVDPETLEPLK